VLRELARDLAPGQAERVERILRRWDESRLHELQRLLGKRRAENLLSQLEGT